MHYLSAYTFMNRFLLCSEKVLQIDLNLSFLQIITRFTCVCAFFVVSLRFEYENYHTMPANFNELTRVQIPALLHLERLGITDNRVTNQIANFTYLDYQTNIEIGDKAPAEYIKDFKTRLGEEAFAKTCSENALPEGFENMEYLEFLEKRRKLMSNIIRKAYERLQ